jgi:hypothetical protein
VAAPLGCLESGLDVAESMRLILKFWNENYRQSRIEARLGASMGAKYILFMWVILWYVESTCRHKSININVL